MPRALLITALPEMFIALEALVKGVCRLPPLTAIAGVLEAEVKQANAAIAKVKGENDESTSSC